MAVVVYSVVDFNNKYWTIFLTNWGDTVCVIYLIFGSVLSIYYKSKTSSKPSQIFGSSSFGSGLELTSTSSNGNIPNDVVFQETSFTNSLPMAVRIYWLIANLAYINGALIVILYWGFVHHPRFLVGFGQAFVNINMHGIIYCLVVIDFWMSSIPIRIMHGIYAIAFGLTYGLFSAIFTLATGRPIYPVLKWNTSPGQAAVFCLIALGFAVFMHLVFYGCDRFKKRNRTTMP